MNDRMKAALIGGAVIGVMSIIPFINSCCCLWAVAGGVLAAFIYKPKSPTPLSTGDGAMLGAMAGGVGALIYLIISVPLTLIFSMANLAQMEEQLRAQGIALPFSGVALALVSMLMMVVGLVAFAALGGVIGVPLFEKRGSGNMPPPPPPPDFSQTPGGFNNPQGPGNYGGPTGGGSSFGSGV